MCNQIDTCNKCGKINFYTNDIIDNMIQRNLMHKFIIEFGFGSKFDMSQCKFLLCEDCLVKIIESFKVPIILEESNYNRKVGKEL